MPQEDAGTQAGADNTKTQPSTPEDKGAQKPAPAAKSSQDTSKNSDDSDKGDDDEDVSKLPEKTQRWLKGLQTKLANVKDESKGLKEKLAEYEAKEQAAEEERLKKAGEHEKLYQAEKAKGESLRHRILAQEVALHAKDAGIIDLDAVKLIDTSKVKLTESGEVLGAKEAVEAFKTAKPVYFQAPAAAPASRPTGSAATPPPPGSGATLSGQDAARELVKLQRENPAEYRATVARLKKSSG